MNIVAFAALLGYSGVGYAQLYVTDSTKGEISFHLSSTLHEVHGHAGEWHGRVDFNPTTGKAVTPFEIQVPVQSLETDNAARDRAMLKMFENKLYPDAVWEVETWSCPSFKPGKVAECKASGVFKMHGKAYRHLAIVKLKPVAGGFESTMNLELNIDEFGLKPPSVLGLIHVEKTVYLSVRTEWKKSA